MVQYKNVTAFINFKQMLPSVENVNRSSLNKKLFAKECRLKKKKLQMLSALINKDPPHGDLSLTKKYQIVSLW